MINKFIMANANKSNITCGYIRHGPKCIQSICAIIETFREHFVEIRAKLKSKHFEHTSNRIRLLQNQEHLKLITYSNWFSTFKRHKMINVVFIRDWYKIVWYMPHIKDSNYVQGMISYTDFILTDYGCEWL